MRELPPGWIEAPLRELGVEAQSGFPSGKHNAVGRGTPHLRPMNVDRLGRIDLGEVKYVEDNRDRRLLPGDVLFNNTNSPALIGKTAYFDKIGDFAFSNHMTRLRVGEGVDAKYLAIYLHTLWMRGLFERLCSHHVNQASVSTKRLLSEVEVAVPPLNEQRRIVAAIEEPLSRLEAAEASLAAALLRLTGLRQRIVDTTCGHGEVTRLRELLAEPLVNGRSVPTLSDGFPVLRLSALRAGLVDLRERKLGDWDESDAERFLVHKGDFFVARGNGSLRLVGRGGLVVDEPDRVAFPDTLIRVRADGATIASEYLRLVWDTTAVRAQIERRARTTAGIYKVNQQDLRDIALPVPPLEEQQRIVQEVEERLSRIDAMRASIERAQRRSQTLRAAILERAFSGELVPQDPADEPAEALLARIRVERESAAAHSGRGCRRE